MLDCTNNCVVWHAVFCTFRPTEYRQIILSLNICPHPHCSSICICVSFLLEGLPAAKHNAAAARAQGFLLLSPPAAHCSQATEPPSSTCQQATAAAAADQQDNNMRRRTPARVADPPWPGWRSTPRLGCRSSCQRRGVCCWLTSAAEGPHRVGHGQCLHPGNDSLCGVWCWRFWAGLRLLPLWYSSEWQGELNRNRQKKAGGFQPDTPLPVLCSHVSWCMHACMHATD